MKKKLPLEDRLSEKILKRLEWTGLVKNANLILKDFEDKEGVNIIPYITFRRTESNQTKECLELTTYLLSQMKQTQPEIAEISYSINPNTKKLDGHLVLELGEENYITKFQVRKMLNAFNGALKSYLFKHKIPDPYKN